MSMKRVLILLLVAVSLISCSPYSEYERPLERSVILIIGDGMGQAHLDTTSIHEKGSEGLLTMQQAPVKTMARTSSLYGLVTDSAAAATAMATGQKVINGRISMDMFSRRFKTLLEYAKLGGLNTALVSTAYLTHATPAAFAAHARNRDEYEKIARDYLSESRPDILFGGGGHGLDAERLQSAGYQVATDTDSFLLLDALRVAGLFSDGHLPYHNDRTGVYPSLSMMSQKALEILLAEPEGFFLMIESGRIDHASHRNDLQRMIGEVSELDRTIELIMQMIADRDDILLVVTADHETGGLRDPVGLYDQQQLQEGAVDPWTTGGHTGVDVPLFAWGADASIFEVESIDNTDIFHLIIGSGQ